MEPLLTPDDRYLQSSQERTSSASSKIVWLLDNRATMLHLFNGSREDKTRNVIDEYNSVQSTTICR